MKCQTKSKPTASQQHHSKASLKRALARGDREAIRAIGERLHSFGGTPLMLDAFWEACGNDPLLMSRLGSAWEGVGGQWYR